MVETWWGRFSGFSGHTLRHVPIVGCSDVVEVSCDPHREAKDCNTKAHGFVICFLRRYDGTFTTKRVRRTPSKVGVSNDASRL